MISRSAKKQHERQSVRMHRGRIREHEHAQEDSQTSLLAAIVASSDDAITGKTLDGIITTWNPAAERIYGYTAEEMIGKPVSRLIYPDRPDEMPEILSRIRAGERIDHYDTVRVKKGGVPIFVSLTVSPIYDREGRVVGASSIARDITERKRTEQHMREDSSHARSLIEASLDPLVTISPEGKITDVNEATVKVTGAARERLVGTDFSDYFTEPDKAREGYREAFEKGLVTDYPLTMRHKDGRLTDVLYNATVYRDASGQVLGVFAAARDVTARKRAEAELASQRERELERLAELERFQRLTVGRELKMIELKREIDELRRQLSAEGERQ
jgi:PAS domain S-box-containing protein